MRERGTERGRETQREGKREVDEKAKEDEGCRGRMCEQYTE